MRDPIGKLANIIKENSGCVAIVDNDCWTLYKKHPHSNPFDDDNTDNASASAEKWDKQNELASDDTHGGPDNGYGSGNCYGGDILQALARIVGITVESV